MSEKNGAFSSEDIITVKQESGEMTGHIEICFYGKKTNIKIQATVEQTIYAYTSLIAAIHKNTDSGFMIGLLGSTMKDILETDCVSNIGKDRSQLSNILQDNRRPNFTNALDRFIWAMDNSPSR